MSRYRLAITLVLTVLLTGVVQSAFAESVNLPGSTTTQKRVIEPASDLLAEKTGIIITIRGTGTGQGIYMLLTDQITYNAALASSSLQSAIESARKVSEEPLSQAAIDQLQEHVLLRDEIVPIVHKSNPVQHLTFQQLSDINTGKVTNWDQVGGADLPIIVITSHSGSATRKVFQDIVMNEKDYSPAAREVKSTREEIKLVERMRGAIGAVSKGFVLSAGNSVAVVDADEISRPLSIITKGDPNEIIQKVIDFYRTDEAIKLIN